MKQWMKLAEDAQDGGEYIRSAADLGLYIMTHGFRIAFQPDEIHLFRADQIKGGISSNHPGRYILIDQKLNPHKMYPINDAYPIQAELENVTLTWLGWYRLYREVLGTLLEVGRAEEALLLAEEALKVRIDGKHKDQEHSYKREMQSIVLAITLSYNQYTRSYRHLTDWIRKSIKGTKFTSVKFTCVKFICVEFICVKILCGKFICVKFTCVKFICVKFL